MSTSADVPTSLLNALTGFVAANLMPDPEGLAVWDLGCGHGDAIGAFLELGASHVLASDVVLLRDQIPQHHFTDRRVGFVEGGFDSIRKAYSPDCIVPADLIFMHLMTEHVPDLRGFFIDLAAMLRPGATIFVHHDCYYQPAGQHDHGFVRLNPATWFVEQQSVQCWNSEEKCQVSADHRAELHRDRFFQWSEQSEATRDPTRCDHCNYYRRSWPWAHLTFSQQHRELYPEPWFKDNLNRATTRQVQWWIQEAGFTVTAQHRYFVENVPPPDLIYQFGQEELTTLAYTVRATRDP